MEIDGKDRAYLGRVLAFFKGGKHFTTGAFARNVFGDPVPLRSEDAHSYDLSAAMTVVALHHSFPMQRANELMAMIAERVDPDAECMQKISDSLGWTGVNKMIQEMVGGA